MNFHRWFKATTLAVVATTATPIAFAAGDVPPAPASTAVTTPAAAPITKEQAIEMALKAHPGQVTKAYEETKKGKKTWEVKIKGDDGKKWEMYYEIATGELIAEEED